MQEETEAKGIADLSNLVTFQDDIYLWQGDITTLLCWAIVNAADAVLLGAGSGLSTAAGLAYSGKQFMRHCGRKNGVAKV